MGNMATINPLMDRLVAYKPVFKPRGMMWPETRIDAISPNKIRGILLDKVFDKDMAVP
jgi:hypothetical protein